MMHRIEKFKYFLLLLIWVISLNAAHAQTNLGNEQVNVVKPYMPILSDGYKISEVPEQDTLMPKKQTFSYVVNPKKFTSFFDITPIKASRQADEPFRTFDQNSIQAGIGNFLTTYFEGFLNLTSSPEYSIGLHGKHLSTQPQSAAHSNQTYSKNEVSLFGARYFEKSILSADFSAERKATRNYGLSPDTLFAGGIGVRRFMNISPSVRWKTQIVESNSTRFDIGLKYNLLDVNAPESVSAFGNMVENNFIVDAGTGFKLGKLSYAFNALADYNYLNRDYSTPSDGKSTHGLIQLNPKAIKLGNKWDLTTGTNLIFYPHEELNGKFKWNPKLYSDVNFNAKIFTNILSVYGGIGGGVIKNNMKNLMDVNPFLSTEAPILYSKNTLDLKLGLKGAWSKSSHWLLKSSFSTIEDMPFFVNEWNNSLENSFTLVYDDVEILNFHGELNHSFSPRFSIFLKGDYFNYHMDKLAYAWHKSNFESTLEGTYRLGAISFLSFLGSGEFTLKGGLFFSGARYAQDLIYDATSTSVISVPVKLKPFLDASLALEYQLNARFNFFARMNNLGFSPYQRWLNYPTQKFNFMFGAGYTF